MAQHRASQLGPTGSGRRAHLLEAMPRKPTAICVAARLVAARPVLVPVSEVNQIISPDNHFNLTKISGDSLKYISKWTIHAVRHYKCNPSRVTGWAGGRPVFTPLCALSVQCNCLLNCCMVKRGQR